MSDAPRVTVALVDDHPLVRAGIRRAVEALAHVRVVGEAGTAAEGIALVERERPDLLLLDLNLPDSDGFEVLRRLRAAGAPTRVLVLSLRTEPGIVQRAVREGAAGYLVKDLAVRELGDAIEAVSRGGAYFSASAQRALANATRGATGGRLDALTPRERDVLRDVARGLPSKAIAHEHGISPRTVESHRASLMRKLDVHSVAELTRIAMEEGLLGPGPPSP